MRMKVILTALIFSVLSLGLSACSGSRGGGAETSNLKQIQQQRAGDTIVTVFSETGQLKQGPSKFVLEFRKASDNTLLDVGNVQLQSLMPMPGMAPMSAGASAAPSGTAGRYDVTADFPMIGKWNFTVIFGKGQRAPLSLNVQ